MRTPVRTKTPPPAVRSFPACFSMDPESWDALHWLAEELKQSRSETVRLAIIEAAKRAGFTE